MAEVGALAVSRPDWGEPRIVFRGDRGGLDLNLRTARAGLEWTPDGSHLLFLASEPNSTFDRRRHIIMAVPAEGGPPKRLFSIEMGRFMLGLSLHPDGQRVAFTGGGLNADYVSELWVMENLSPPREGSGQEGSR